MFKAILLSMVLAASGHATVSNTTPIEVLNGGLLSPQLVPVGTPVYALNMALTGTSSAAIDLSNTAGLWVSITSAASTMVSVYFSNQNLTFTTGAVSMYQINAAGSYPITPKARYVSFYNASNQPSARVSLNYLPMVAPAVTAQSSASEIAGITMTAAMLQSLNGAYLDVSSTSATGVTTNAAVTRSLTFVASTSAGMLDLDIIGCAGATTVYYKVHDGVTPPAFYTTNPTQGSAFLCGTTHLIEPRRFMGANPHITFYAAGLSATSATVSFGLLSRTAQ